MVQFDPQHKVGFLRRMDKVERSFAQKLLSDRSTNYSPYLRQKGVIGDDLHEQVVCSAAVTQTGLIATGRDKDASTKQETEGKLSHRLPAIQLLFFQLRERPLILVQS